jgi:hypothetical protein
VAPRATIAKDFADCDIDIINIRARGNVEFDGPAAFDCSLVQSVDVIGVRGAAAEGRDDSEAGDKRGDGDDNRDGPQT